MEHGQALICNDDILFDTGSGRSSTKPKSARCVGKDFNFWPKKSMFEYFIVWIGCSMCHVELSVMTKCKLIGWST